MCQSHLLDQLDQLSAVEQDSLFTSDIKSHIGRFAVIQ